MPVIFCLLSSSSIVRPPGTAVPDGLMFYRRCIFFSPRILRGPSTDRPETLPQDLNLAVVYNPTPKIWGALPPKKLGAKNMQNFGQFSTTSEFDHEYLRNAATYPKRKDVRTSKIPPAFDEKSPVNFGPLTAWNYM